MLGALSLHALLLLFRIVAGLVCTLAGIGTCLLRPLIGLHFSGFSALAGIVSYRLHVLMCRGCPEMRYRSSRRVAMIGLGKEIMVAPRCLHMLRLEVCRLNMMFVHGLYFFRAWPCHYAAAAAIVAHVVVNDSIASYNRAVDINIVHHGTVYIDNRSVIPEHISGPHATGEAYTKVAAPVIDTAVEAHMRTPIAGVV